MWSTSYLGGRYSAVARRMVRATWHCELHGGVHMHMPSCRAHTVPPPGIFAHMHGQPSFGVAYLRICMGNRHLVWPPHAARVRQNRHQLMPPTTAQRRSADPTVRDTHIRHHGCSSKATCQCHARGPANATSPFEVHRKCIHRAARTAVAGALSLTLPCRTRLRRVHTSPVC